MVDFNNEITVGVPAVDVQKISILQRRYDLIEAFEHYKKGRLNGAGMTLALAKARLISLFLELQALLKRRLEAKGKNNKGLDYDTIYKIVFDPKATEEDFLEVFFSINEELDNMRLTRVDNQTAYNSRNVEEENRVKGY